MFFLILCLFYFQALSASDITLKLYCKTDNFFIDYNRSQGVCTTGKPCSAYEFAGIPVKAGKHTLFSLITGSEFDFPEASKFPVRDSSGLFGMLWEKNKLQLLQLFDQKGNVKKTVVFSGNKPIIEIHYSEFENISGINLATYVTVKNRTDDTIIRMKFRQLHINEQFGQNLCSCPDGAQIKEVFCNE
jgi:hypothetical protein